MMLEFRVCSLNRPHCRFKGALGIHETTWVWSHGIFSCRLLLTGPLSAACFTWQFTLKSHGIFSGGIPLSQWFPTGGSRPPRGSRGAGWGVAKSLRVCVGLNECDFSRFSGSRFLTRKWSIIEEGGRKAYGFSKGGRQGKKVKTTALCGSWGPKSCGI